MKVAEVESLFTPLADAAMEKGMTLPQVQRALSAVMVMRALERHGRKQTLVAQFLGVSTFVVSKIVNGSRKLPMTKKPKRTLAKDWAKKHGGDPKTVLGAVEL